MNLKVMVDSTLKLGSSISKKRLVFKVLNKKVKDSYHIGFSIK